MNLPNQPEDSTLRRHAASAAAFRLEAFLADGPSDSTLRRHAEQMRSAQAATPASEHPTPSQAETPPRQPNHEAADTAPATDRGASGLGALFAWLSRVFRG